MRKTVFLLTVLCLGAISTSAQIAMWKYYSDCKQALPCGDMAWKAQDKSDKWLMINMENGQPFSAQYDSISPFKDGFALAMNSEDGRWRVAAVVSLAKLEEKTIGKVVLKDCENTRVINELDIPIVALSLKDTLVAASSDGILVSPLDKANGIKPVLESLETGEIRYAEKSWGKYQVIDVTPESLVVRADIKAGHRMSYHAHARRDEVWTIIAGSGTTIVDGMSQHVHPGDVIAISAGCRHTIIAEEDLSIIEVQLGKEINVNDKQKFDYEQ